MKNTMITVTSCRPNNDIIYDFPIINNPLCWKVNLTLVKKKKDEKLNKDDNDKLIMVVDYDIMIMMMHEMMVWIFIMIKGFDFIEKSQ